MKVNFSVHAKKSRREEMSYSSTNSTWALNGDEWLTSYPGRIIPREKPPVHVKQGAGWTPEPVLAFGEEEEGSCFLCRGSNPGSPS